MFRRYLSEEFFQYLPTKPFWKSITDDRELHPEIRDNAVTIYYCGAALIRDLRVAEGKLSGQLHFKYVPVLRQGSSPYVSLMAGESGLGFADELRPLPLGNASPEVLSEYKRMMQSVNHKKREYKIVHSLVCRTDHQILDQEVEFQLPGESRHEKIDICHFDTALGCLSFVEVKEIHDYRLRPGADGTPEVVKQLDRYSRRLREQRSEILEAYRLVVSYKRQLGLGDRLQRVPEDGPKQMLSKAVLVIGNCSSNDVATILNAQDEWGPLIEGLRQTAAGLILCGKDGGRMNLERDSQRLVFDSSVQ
ncbi:MAG: hypothetical protein ACUVQH_05185 [Thermogutta sp.]